MTRAGLAVVACALAALACTSVASAAGRAAEPPLWLCVKAAALRSYAGSDAAALALARAHGISEEVIARARRCRR
jgi:hypothetical protein